MAEGVEREADRCADHHAYGPGDETIGTDWGKAMLQHLKLTNIGPAPLQVRDVTAVAKKVPDDVLQEDEKLLLWYD